MRATHITIRFSALIVATIACSAVAQSEQWSTQRTAPAKRQDNAAIASQACREFNNVNVPPPAAHRPGGGADNGAAPPAPPSAANNSANPHAPGSAHARWREIPYTISLLCEDQTLNQNEIASLYLTLKGKPPVSTEAAPLTPAPVLNPARMGAADALARLQTAALQFIRLRVDNEIESNLRERTWTTVDNAKILQDQFVALQQQVDAGRFPADFALDPHSNQQLASTYNKVHARVAALGVEWELQDCEDTQRAWAVYRDAWLAYLAASYPQISRPAFSGFLTRERINQLEQFYATGDR